MYREVASLLTSAYVSMQSVCSKPRMTSLALYLMSPSGLCFRLNTYLELIASVRAFASAASNVLYWIMASYCAWMARCQFFFSGLSIASRYVSKCPSEPVSAFAIITTAVAFPLAMLLVTLAPEPSSRRSFSLLLWWRSLCSSRRLSLA